MAHGQCGPRIAAQSVHGPYAHASKSSHLGESRYESAADVVRFCAHAKWRCATHSPAPWMHLCGFFVRSPTKYCVKSTSPPKAGLSRKCSLTSCGTRAEHGHCASE